MFKKSTLLLGSLMFFEYRVLGSLTIPDIIFIIVIILLFFSTSRVNFRGSFFLLFFILSSFLSLIVTYNYNFFSIDSYTNNQIRLLFFIVGCFYIPNYISNNIQNENISNLISLSLIFISFIAFLELLIPGFNLDFFYRENNLTSSNRTASVFREPAHLSIFLGNLAAINMAIRPFLRNKPKFFILSLTLSIITLFISKSLVGFLFGSVLLFFAFNSLNEFFSKRYFKRVLYLVRVFLVFVPLFLFTYFMANSFDFEILERIFNIAYLDRSDDGSSQSRIIGNYLYTALALENYLFFGIGNGQLTPYFESLIKLPTFYYQVFKGGINNIFSSLLIQFGLLGFICFSLFIIKVFKNRLLALVFIITSLSWGFFNTAMFWVLIYFSISFYIQNKKINTTQ